MTDRVTDVLAINREPRLLVGTRAGRLFECAVAGTDHVLPFAGLEGRRIAAAAVSPDGALVLAFDDDGRGLVWDRENGEALDELRSPAPVIQCAAIARDDYITLSNDRSAHVWSRDAAGVRPSPIMDSPGAPISSYAFGVPDEGDRVLLLDGFRWRVWDRRTGAVVDSHTPIDGMHVDNPAGDIGLSRNGRYYYAYWDTYLVMDTSDRRVVRDEQVIVDPMTSALSNDGRVLVVGGRDGVVMAIGSDGEAVFDNAPGTAVIVRVTVGDDGRLATFVDAEGGAGCIDVGAGALLVSPEWMDRILDLPIRQR